jgi:hypothetical protein
MIPDNPSEMSFNPTGILESWKPASYFRHLAKKANVAIERIITVSRTDGRAQYHVLEFQSSSDMINAQMARLLERDILTLNLRMPLMEALDHPCVMDAAIDNALAARRRMEMRRLHQRGMTKQLRSKRETGQAPRPQPINVEAGDNDGDEDAKVVTSFGCASADECARLRQAKAHMAAAAAAAALAARRSGRAGQAGRAATRRD